MSGGSREGGAGCLNFKLALFSVFCFRFISPLFFSWGVAVPPNGLQRGDGNDAADAVAGAGIVRLLRGALHRVPGISAPELGGRNPARPSHVHARRNKSHDENAGAVARVRGPGLPSNIDIPSEATVASCDLVGRVVEWERSCHNVAFISHSQVR